MSVDHLDPNPFILRRADAQTSAAVTPIINKPIIDIPSQPLPPLLTPQQAAPADYYQNTFIEVFDFVLKHFENIAPPGLIHSLGVFLQAGDDAQRLFARLLTRRGPVFFEDNLIYREVNHLSKALEALQHMGLIRRSNHVPGDWLLDRLTKTELVDYFPYAAIEAKRENKKALMVRILGHYSDLRIAQLLAPLKPWCVIREPRHWQWAQLLYFGRTGKDWSTHIRRDLGQVRYEQVELSKSRFSSRHSFNSYLAERKLRTRIYRLDEYPQLLPGLLNALTRPPTDIISQRLRQRSLLKLGKRCEQQGDTQAALHLYQQVTIPPARERRVRIHVKAGQAEQSQQLLAEIRRAPLSATESIFAQRFGRRGQGFQPSTSQWTISQTPADVEGFVLETLVESGGWGVHCENALVKSLTGLIYWHAIFAPEPGAFTNPFQSAPQDLMDQGFASQRLEILEQIETAIQTDQSLCEHVVGIAKAKQGIANPLVSWKLLESIPIEEWLTAMPLSWVRQLSHFLIRNLADYRKGLPDLFVCYADGRAEFVEVKGPTDQLQPQQRAWFEVFVQLAIPARVIKLKL